MSLINAAGKKVQLNEQFDQIFDIVPNVQLMDWNDYTIFQSTLTHNVKVEPYTYYVMNPYNKAVNTTTLKPNISALNANGEVLTLTKSDGSTVTDVQFVSYYILYIEDKSLKIYTASNGTLAKEKRFQRTVGSYTTDEEIDSIKFSLVAFHNDDYKYGVTMLEHLSDSYVDLNIIGAKVKDVRDFWEQFSSKIIQYSVESESFMPYIRCESIRQMNHSRDCIRVGTFNKSANVGADNNDGIKQMFSDYGIDFVGLQEVKNDMDNYPEALTSYALPYVDNAETADKSPFIDNKILSRYPIKTSTRVTYTVPEGKDAQEWRGYTRCEIPLPRYKDYYPDGDQVLSFYATHFDPDDVCRLSEVDELIAALLEDKNKFKVIVADTNDFDLEKPTWKALTDAGFIKIHDGSSKTVTRDEALNKNSALDNIFCSSNISVVYYDIVNTTNRQILLTNGAMSPMSDHDFVYADLKLNYEL